jgi:hypothetical protein
MTNFIIKYNDVAYSSEEYGDYITFVDNKNGILNTSTGGSVANRTTISYDLDKLVKTVNGNNDTRAKGGLVVYGSSYSDTISSSKYRYDNNNTGSFKFSIEYSGLVDQVYYGRTTTIDRLGNPVINTQNTLDIGDNVRSNITANGKNYNYSSLNYYYTAENINMIDDNSSTYNRLGSASITKSIYSITRDGVTYTENATLNAMNLKSDDVVTYRCKIDLSHQNFQSLTIYDYLPLPVILINDMDVTTVASVFDTSVPSSASPSANMIKYGPLHTFYDSSDSTIYKHPVTITKSTASNSFKVYYDNFQMPYYSNILNHKIGPKVIDILYSLRVNDKPTADKLKMTNQNRFTMTSTVGYTTTGYYFSKILIDQPSIDIKKAVVSSNSTASDIALSPTTLPITLSFNTDGFTGSLNLTSNDVINDMVNLNRGDKVKYFITLKNTGSQTAYNVTIIDDDTNNLSVTDTSTIKVYDGYGNRLDTPTLNKNNQSNALANYSNGTGLDIGDVPAKSNQSSVRIIIYEATVATRSTEIIANQNVIDKTKLSNYANVNKGLNFVSGNIFDDCQISLRNVSIDRKITYRSQDPTNFTEYTSRNITIGEIVRIKSTVKIPPGVVNQMVLRDEMDFTQNTQSNAGVEPIKTRISITGGSFTGNSGDINNVLTNYTDSTRYRNYTFGVFTNNTNNDVFITVTQYHRVTNNTHAGSYIYRKSGVSTGHNTSSNTNIAVLRNTSTNLITSANTTMSISEPQISLTKNFYPNVTNYSKDDIIIYELVVSTSGTSGNIVPNNLLVTDVVPSSITVSKAYLSGQSNSPFAVNTNNISYSFGQFPLSTTRRIYIEGKLNEYISANTIINTCNATYNNMDSSRDIGTYYQAPSDDSTVYDGLNLSKTFRSYSATDSNSFTTYPTLSHSISNITVTNPVNNHPGHPLYAPYNVSCTVGDIISATAIASIPKGTTYIRELQMLVKDDINNLIFNTNGVQLLLGDNVTHNRSNNSINITPVIMGSYVKFPVNLSFENNGESFENITLSYSYKIKNTTSNVNGKVLSTNYLMLIENSIDQQTHSSYKVVESLTDYIDYLLVEPDITLSQEILEMPLTNDDTFKIKLSIHVDESKSRTVAFNPFLHFTPGYEISTVNVNSIPLNWSYEMNQSNQFVIKYNGSDNNISTYNNYLSVGTDVEFILTMKLNVNAGLTKKTPYQNIVFVKWVGQSIYSESDDSIEKRNYNDDTSNGMINNYHKSDNTHVYVTTASEKLRFGLMCEDALDFDYDYNDVVMNCDYKIFRNKKGIKLFIFDLHLLVRGASYDHTLGVYFDKLKTKTDGAIRSGRWKVKKYVGESNTVLDSHTEIMSYLDRGVEDQSTFNTLRNNKIPIVISTYNNLVPDNSHETFSFGANCNNRTEEVTNWIKPTTYRLIVEFDDDSELLDNGKYLLPYLEVRSGQNNWSSPKYNDYEYEKILGGKIPVSFKEFVYDGYTMDYTNFPHMIVTPIDFHTAEDYGEVEGYHSLKDVYLKFIDYVTNGDYPSTDNMKDMTKIDDRIEEVIHSQSWCNDANHIVQAYLLKQKSSDYQTITVKDKEILNNYKEPNLFKLGNDALPTNNVQLLSDGSNEQVIINGESVSLSTYINNIPTNKKIIGFNKSRFNRQLRNNDFALIEIDTTSKNTNVISSVATNNVNGNNLRTISFGKNNLLGINGSELLYNQNVNDINTHTNGRDVRKIANYKDDVVITIDDKNNIVLTGSSDIDVSEFYDVGIIDIQASDNAIVLITTNNDVYLIDEEGNKKQIFINKKIDTVEITNKTVYGVSQYSILYAYDIQDGILNGSEPTVSVMENVSSISAEDDWFAALTNNGEVFVLDGPGSKPNIPNVEGKSYVAKTTNQQAYVNLLAVNNSLVLSYV